jgi:hypothetical protein
MMNKSQSIRFGWFKKAIAFFCEKQKIRLIINVDGCKFICVISYRNNRISLIDANFNNPAIYCRTIKFEELFFSLRSAKKILLKLIVQKRLPRKLFLFSLLFCIIWSA